MRLAGAMLEVFAAAGAESETVHLYEQSVMPCRACGCCRGIADAGGMYGTVCPLADAMPGLARSLAAADAVVVASPLYFTSLSAPVIAFFSRLQPFWEARGQGRGAPTAATGGCRQAALAVSAGAEYDNMFRPARSVAAAAFHSLGLHFAGMATAAGTDRIAAAENADALRGAAELAAMMLVFLRGGAAGGDSSADPGAKSGINSDANPGMDSDANGALPETV